MTFFLVVDTFNQVLPVIWYQYIHGWIANIKIKTRCIGSFSRASGRWQTMDWISIGPVLHTRVIIYMICFAYEYHFTSTLLARDSYVQYVLELFVCLLVGCWLVVAIGRLFGPRGTYYVLCRSTRASTVDCRVIVYCTLLEFFSACTMYCTV
jgi:hypothetical protein